MHSVGTGAAEAVKKIKALLIAFGAAFIQRVVSYYAIGLLYDWHFFTWFFVGLPHPAPWYPSCLVLTRLSLPDFGQLQQLCYRHRELGLAARVDPCFYRIRHASWSQHRYLHVCRHILCMGLRGTYSRLHWYLQGSLPVRGR